MSKPAAGIPSDAPPDYDTATAPSSSTTSNRLSAHGPSSQTERNGIPAAHRRSMEDELRELPPGWVRQFDPVEKHQFFVDTRANPPRSIWVHPYDDPDFLATLSPEERKKHSHLQRSMTLEDLAAEDTDEEYGNSHGNAPRSHHDLELPPRPDGKHANKSTPNPNDTNADAKGIHKYTRKMKDKVTGTTHTEREAQRQHREAQERAAYETHLKARQAMSRAMETGQPQFLCKDRDGRDVYIEPPNGPLLPPGQGAYGYNPYQHGPYNDPNARFVRPQGPYGRPVGYGYGGGYGIRGGYGAPVAAGFLGGALLGSVLF